MVQDQESSSTSEDVAQIFPNSLLDSGTNQPGEGENGGAVFLKVKYLEQENKNLYAELTSFKKRCLVAQDFNNTLNIIKHSVQNNG